MYSIAVNTFVIFLHFSLISTFSSLLSSYARCWYRSPPGLWPQTAQLTSLSCLPATISTRTPNRAPSWSATSARQAPMCQSTAPWQQWGNVAPVRKAHSHGVRMVSSSAIAARRHVLQALLRKCPARPPRTASARVPPTASSQGMVALSASLTHYALQGPGLRSEAARWRTCSVSHAPRGLSQMQRRTWWSAEATQTVKLRDWCCSHQGLETQIMCADHLLQLRLPLRLSPQPLDWSLHRMCLYKNLCLPHPLDLYTKVGAEILFLVCYVNFNICTFIVSLLITAAVSRFLTASIKKRYH